MSIGRVTAAAFYRAHQYAAGMARQRMRNAAGVVNDGGGTGVGGADHGAFKLYAAHARDVQVLIDGYRVAKPANVADVDHHGGGGGWVSKPRGEFFAKQVFIANVGRDALALPVERWLLEVAPVEV